MLESALRCPRGERSTADFGAWAFAFSLDDDQLVEFRDEVVDALARFGAGSDHFGTLLGEWRATASFMADEDATSGLGGGVEGFVEVPHPEVPRG